MKGHAIEVLAQSEGSGFNAEAMQATLNRLTNNAPGHILNSADASTFNCMKLAHYLPIYQELFDKMRGNKVNLLEIGVQHGGFYRL